MSEQLLRSKILANVNAQAERVMRQMACDLYAEIGHDLCLPEGDPALAHILLDRMGDYLREHGTHLVSFWGNLSASKKLAICRAAI